MEAARPWQPPPFIPWAYSMEQEALILGSS
jgi:hypothetical protein